MPDVSGPIDGEPVTAMSAEMADDAGYVEEEYFLSGEATAYESDVQLPEDGVWNAVPGEQAAYTTRVVVRRPSDMAEFNGTVAVEWFNVTANVDADPDFGMTYPVLLGDGYAYIGVSAQRVGIEGTGEGGFALDIPGIPPELLQPLKVLDPERYGPLSHPGDPWSYDIFTQVAGAARAGDLLDGVVPEHLLAMGDSQSAIRLATYVNAVQPLTNAYDGFLIHSRGAGAAGLDDAPLSQDPLANPTTIREDTTVPVLQLETETDLALGFVAARQPDSDQVVTWEVAGAAHADNTQLEYGRITSPDIQIDLGTICGSINDGPGAELARAALVSLNRWVVDDTPPPTATIIETDAGTIVRADDGIAIGGVRTPYVDAPAAVHSGETQSDSIVCTFFGDTTPFTAQQLADRYPTHDDYVEAVTESADAAVEAGFLLAADRDALVAEAEDARVP